eukprot:m.210690 g.210690  ORF g.210690 m.210690 type:complete len:804 (-) comp33088_c0_seq1:655-3066(-)
MARFLLRGSGARWRLRNVLSSSPSIPKIHSISRRILRKFSDEAASTPISIANVNMDFWDEWMVTPKDSDEPAMAVPKILTYEEKTVLKTDEIAQLPEVIELDTFVQSLRNESCEAPVTDLTFESVRMSKDQCMHIITAGLATATLHVESRIAALIGEGFYTIGPSGEELLSAIGLILRNNDSMALHYRHLGTQIARQMTEKDLELILLNRARGHVVSKLDPVTGGVHCSLGGGVYDFIVTSTLASQGPPAVGRAIGNSLAHHLKMPNPRFPKDAVSYVSTGDGSVNNAHFLSAINMAEYAKFRQFKCPMVFGISDNNICISLKGYGWLTSEWLKKLRMPLYEVDGTNLLDIWKGSSEAITKARKTFGPVALIFKDLPRRFGHAASDRQSAYLTKTAIATASHNNPLAGACAQAVEAGFTTYAELDDLVSRLQTLTRSAFIKAAAEPKLVSREELLERTSRPLESTINAPLHQKSTGRKHVMRKNMNMVMDEILSDNPRTVYIGEDVEHGGYYLVTEGLHKKHPNRVKDFPPDETSLFGIGIGFSQCGLVPIVEMPYAKYLDCGFDMFGEVAIGNWLSNSQHPNGMIIRLQGFDKGVFGGNYHTHNMLQIPPGIDVVCYSNGEDYVRGWRYAIQQAAAGRVIMSVDSTNLLNLRHLHDEDDKWRRAYPSKGEVLKFDEVVRYGKGKKLGIVTYGNGVVAALQARVALRDFDQSEVVVIDSPYLNRATTGLKQALSEVDAVVFADVCKQGQNPLAGIIAELKSEDALPAKWNSVAALPTYNPLGSTITFTNKDSIVEACNSLFDV